LSLTPLWVDLCNLCTPWYQQPSKLDLEVHVHCSHVPQLATALIIIIIIIMMMMMMMMMITMILIVYMARTSSKC